MKARALLLAWTLIGATGTSTPAAAGGFAVIVHHDNPVSAMSRSELKRVFTGGTKQWDSGAVVQIGVIPSDAPETQHLASLLDTTPRELLARIQEQVFKGELRRPAILRTSTDCVAFARSVPGAVCVTSETVLPPEVHVVVVQ